MHIHVSYFDNFMLHSNVTRRMAAKCSSVSTNISIINSWKRRSSLDSPLDSWICPPFIHQVNLISQFKMHELKLDCYLKYVFVSSSDSVKKRQKMTGRKKTQGTTDAAALEQLKP